MSRAGASCAGSWPAACVAAGPCAGPRGRVETRGRIKNMVMISQRPAEADDRAVPGHWEGDLLVGKDGKTPIATLVERSTRYVMLAKIPNAKAETVAAALAVTVARLPAHLWRSLTWDQGRKWPATNPSASPPASPSTSATPTAPGSAAPTRTPTACYASTSPKAPACASTAKTTSTGPPSPSTAAPVKHWTGTHQPNASPHSSLQPPVESARINRPTATLGCRLK